MAHELVLEAQLVVEDAASPRSRSRSRGCRPRARPLRRSVSTSRRKPKVRAGAISSAKVRGVMRRISGLVAQQGVVEADRVADLEVLGGDEPRATCLRAPPRPASAPSGTGAARRAAAGPPRGCRITKGAALPSRIGISGPSTSTQHVVDAQAESAESRCSTVSMDTPSRHRVVAWSWRAEVVEGGRDLDPDVGAAEADPMLGRRGPEGEADGLAGVEADPRAADLTLQGSSIGHAPESLPRMIDAWLRNLQLSSLQHGCQKPWASQVVDLAHCLETSSQWV